MTDRGPLSWSLCAFYSFLLFATALSYGSPYPVFGEVFTGRAANAAVLMDCLILLHILIGVWKAQRLSWYLLLSYNGFELASLAATVFRLGAEGLARVAGEETSPQAVQTGAVVLGAALAIATLHAVKLRNAFRNPNPFLF